VPLLRFDLTKLFPSQGTKGPHAQRPDNVPRELDETDGEEEFQDAEDYDNFEAVPPNTEVDFESMAQNYFARVDKIHQQNSEDEDAVLDFEDMSTEEDESEDNTVLEELLRQSMEPLFDGSNTSKLQFSIILMSLCTLFLVNHHCLDEILTFHCVQLENDYNATRIQLQLATCLQLVHCN